MMIGTYSGFRVHAAQLHAAIPDTEKLTRFLTPFDASSTLTVGSSVARVRPRTSKGITDLLLLSFL